MAMMKENWWIFVAVFAIILFVVGYIFVRIKKASKLTSIQKQLENLEKQLAAGYPEGDHVISLDSLRREKTSSKG